MSGSPRPRGAGHKLHCDIAHEAWGVHNGDTQAREELMCHRVNCPSTDEAPHVRPLAGTLLKRCA
eukprot:1266576-Alexandrium_andersonii.AAC.1